MRHVSFILIMLIIYGCKPDANCSYNWVSSKDTNEKYNVIRTYTKDQNYILLEDSFENNFKLKFYKDRLSDIASIQINTLDTNAVTTLYSKNRLIVKGNTYEVLTYMLDDEFSFDEEQYFIWCNPFGLIAYGSPYSDEFFKFITCNRDTNLLAEYLIDIGLPAHTNAH